MTSIINYKSTTSKVQPSLYLPQGRPTASSGLWLGTLLPLSCCPGFYEIHSHCKPPPYIVSVLAIQVGISSFHILYELYSKQANSDDNTSVVLPRSWLVYLITHRYLPVAISFITFFILSKLDNPVVYVCAMVCCTLQFRFTVWLFSHFSDSFSIGEALLVGQAASLTLSQTVKGLLSTSHIKSENQRMFAFAQIAVIIASLLGYILWSLKGRLTLCRLFLLSMALGFFGISISSVILNEWSPVWLLHMLSSPTRIALLSWWMNMSVIIILTAVISQRYSHIPQTVLRKTFHVLMVLIMVPGIILDPTLTYLTSTAAMILFLLLEVIRLIQIEPLSSLLGSMFCIFLDEKDSGSLVLSHIYLLGGLALPLWLYPCDFLHTERLQLSFRDEPEVVKIQFSVLPLLAGVLSVGIGDTAASVGGTYFGRYRFPGTRKTLEGSMCSAVVQLVFLGCVVYFGSMNVELAAWPKLVFSVAISTFVEAFTDQADNIVLPLLLYTPLMDP